MGDIVVILKGDKDHREVEGKAEIVEILTYLGKGLYLVLCVFVNDKTRKKVVREYNIDEPVPGGGVE